jgi:streptomycin 6-kinase
VRVVGALVARLTSAAAPPGLLRLGDIARAMPERVPRALERVPDPADRRLLSDCAAAVREVVGKPGNRLLHWDLHYDNVLAAERAHWVAIDPKPLAGDPGLELPPTIDNQLQPPRPGRDRPALRRADGHAGAAPGTGPGMAPGAGAARVTRRRTDHVPRLSTNRS